MPKRVSIIPKAAVASFFLDAGAGRVGKGAVDELVLVLDDIAKEVAGKSVRAARHAGRKTVTAADVELSR